MCIPACTGTDTTRADISQHALEQTLPWENISQHALGQTHHPLGRHTPRQTPHRQSATAADGMHPTGMHSCLNMIITLNFVRTHQEATSLSLSFSVISRLNVVCAEQEVRIARRVSTSWSGTARSPRRGASCRACTRSGPALASPCATVKYTWQVRACTHQANECELEF